MFKCRMFKFQLYWIGPLLGGVFAGFTYEYIRSTKLKPNQDQQLTLGSPDADAINGRINQVNYNGYHQQSFNMRRDFSNLETELTSASSDHEAARF